MPLRCLRVGVTAAELRPSGAEAGALDARGLPAPQTLDTRLRR